MWSWMSPWPWGQWQVRCIFSLYRLNFPFITPPILDRVTSNLQLSSLTKGTSGFGVISIFKLEYLRFVQSNWDQTGFGKSKMTVTFISIKKSVTFGLADMASWKFQLRISFLFNVGLSHKLVKEIWVVHMTLRLYKISVTKVTLTFGVNCKVNAYSFFIVWFVKS